MKIIKQRIEEINGYENKELGIYKHIEICGRTCYKSEEKITENSYIDFIKKIIKNGHDSVLEHGFLYINKYNITDNALVDFEKEKFFYIIGVAVYGNIRAFREFMKKVLLSPKRFSFDTIEILLGIAGEYPLLFEDIFYASIFKSYSNSNISDNIRTFKFITDRTVSHQLVRHRLCSFSQESQRYVSYNDDIEFILPVYLYEESPESYKFRIWEESCKQSEESYHKLLKIGCSPQEARKVLNNSVKTELVMTAPKREWERILSIRTSEKADPQVRELLLNIGRL